MLQCRRREFAVTIEPIDCTAEGTGVADRLGWVGAQLGAGLTVVLVVEAGSEEERGLLSDRSTGSVWSSAGHGWGEEGSVLQTGSVFTFRSVGCEQSSPTSACWREQRGGGGVRKLSQEKKRKNPPQRNIYFRTEKPLKEHFPHYDTAGG